MAEMPYGRLAGIDKKVSRVGQGTIMLAPAERDRGFALMDAAFEGGVTLFDSAYIYGGGGCETVFGEWVRSRGVREDVVMLDKGGHPQQGESRVSAEAIDEELSESLDRLGFDRIDLYLLHRDDPALPVGEIVEFMNEHIREGRIDAWGGSNWTWPRVREAKAYAEANDLLPMAASSPHFSLAIAFRPVWHDCLSIAGPDHAEERRWYASEGPPLIVWSSMARGFLSGRVTRADDSVLEESARQAFCHPENFDRLERAAELAEEKGVSVAQIALAYVLSVPLDLFALAGPCTPAEFRENAAALDVRLTPDEVAWLETGQR
jgi:aryl-alcohol dehydrogenase-like predicted oxidoreductase